MSDKYLLKDEGLRNVISYALDRNDKLYGLIKGTTRIQVSKSLHMSKERFNKFLSRSEPEMFKCEHLFIILNELHETTSKLILDYIAQKFDFVLSFSANSEFNDISIEQTLLQVTILNGKVNQDYLEAIKDGSIDADELKQMLSQLYMLRQTVVSIENQIKAVANV